MGVVLNNFKTKVDPKEVTASPGSFALLAKKAAILSVVPVQIRQSGFKLNCCAIAVSTFPIIVPGVKT